MGVNFEKTLAFLPIYIVKMGGKRMKNIHKVTGEIGKLQRKKLAEEARFNEEVVPIEKSITERVAQIKRLATLEIEKIKTREKAELAALEYWGADRVAPLEKVHSDKMKQLSIQINEAQASLVVQDFVELVPAEIRPNVIEVSQTSGLVLLQFNQAPAYAVLLRNDQIGGTRWALNIGNSENTGTFYLACACCHLHLSNQHEEAPSEDKEPDSYKSWETGLKEVFLQDFENVCLQHGISRVFLRHADRWANSFSRQPAVSLLEGDEWLSLEPRWPDAEVIEKYFIFE